MPTPGPRLGHAQPSTVLSAGTLLERCSRSDRFASSYRSPRSRPRKSACALLHDDPLAVSFPQSAADPVHLAHVVGLLERAVSLTVLDDLLGDLAADAVECHERL